MNTLNNLRIGVRLGIGFALLITAALGIALFARLSLADVNTELHLLTDDRIVKVEQLEGVKDNVNLIARSVRNLALLSDPAQKATEAKRIDEAAAANAKLLDGLNQDIQSDKGKALLKVVNDARGPYNTSVGAVTQLGLANKAEEATQMLLGETRKVQNAYMTALQALIEFQKELMAQSSKDVDATVAQAGTLMLAIAAVAGAAGALLAWFITRSITRPIQRAVQVAETVAGGDLRSVIEVDSRDETGQLLAALKRMNEALVNTVSTVRGNADSVATASSQIAQGNVDLSQRTEEQASNLQQTAASMEQLTATVKQNADTARQAAQLATSASGVAGQGGEVVGKVVATMEDISHSSKKIADIIGTIDGIAFQTNILALNAAVEAARAGEQGRGFAVVASEVRSLAQRSAQAAKEIKTLIGASVEKVEAGTALVGDAGRTMGEIVSQVRRVNDLISEISAASVEQTSGIGQIGDAVTQLDQVTQQNAALVEESAAAAESLKVQAGQLAQAVSFFMLNEHSAAPQAAAQAEAVTPVARTTPKAAARPAPTIRPAVGKTRTGTPEVASANAQREPATASDDWTAF
ncbi:MAG: MCP four helix bundle domain-containing protein [Rubrivivax sp.]|nr:MCP four helix bundle domain-containing protein [Rubrivivax sp.]